MTGNRQPNPDNRQRRAPMNVLRQPNTDNRTPFPHRPPTTENRTPTIGVPQKRKRAFFFVTRCPLDPQRLDDLLARHKVPPVTTREALHGLPTPAVRPDIYDDEAEFEGPANHLAMRHSKRYHRQPNTVHRQPSSLLPGPMSYRRLHPVRPANTLFSGHRAPPAHLVEPRSITVREAARNIATSIDKGQVSPSSVGLRAVAVSRRSHERQRYA